VAAVKDYDRAFPANARGYRDAALMIRALSETTMSPDATAELASLATAYERLAEYAALSGAAWQTGMRMKIVDPKAHAIDPMRADELLAGETYDSWVCEVCRHVMALARREPGSDPNDMPDAMIRIKCPHCRSQRHYAVHERRVRRYPAEFAAA
jgi:rubrerythrin